MRYLIIVLSLFLITCGGGGGGGPTEPEGPTYVVNLALLSGNAQKGPFNNGTAINIAELTNTLSPTGRNFSTAITDNTGRFSVANVQLTSPYVELRANGFYFNEVSNNLSEAQLTVYALSNLSGKISLNVNILTHLEKNRMITLMSGDNPQTFAQAKNNAQEAVFAIFDYSRANVPESELLDISQGGAANGKLLAISAIVQGNLSVAQMSELLANISTDIASDGTLDDTTLRNTLIDNSKNLDLAQIRANLEARYISLGISATIPDFETEVHQFLKPPVVQDIGLSTDEDTAINITLAGSDPEGESITYSLVDDSNNATITLNGNVANYVPNTHFNGTDTFTYKANDGTSDSNLGTVTITVNAIDDDPNTHDVSATTDEDNAVDISLTADEYDGQNYSFGIIANPSNGAVSLSGTTVTYTPNQDWNGTDTFTFEATDDRIMFGKRNVATATITVNAINDAPVANDLTPSTNEDTQVVITLDTSDVEGDNLTHSIVSDVSNGTTTLSGSTVTYVPSTNWNGTDTFTYKVNDGTVDSGTATVTITVTAVDDDPNTHDVSATTDEDNAVDVSLTADEYDGENYSFSIIANPSNGTISLSGTTVTYTPNQDWNGTDTFTFEATDDRTARTNVATATITVNPINDAPIANDITSQVTDENRMMQLDITLNGTDIDGDALTYNITSTNNGSVSVNDNIATYVPNQDWNGEDTFTYNVNDGTADSNVATVTITVNAVNDAPTAVDRTLNTDEDTAFQINLMVGAPDIDNDSSDLTFSIVSNPSNGTIVLVVHGSNPGSIYWNYTPNANWHGTDTFTYKINDGELDSNVGTVTITVNPIDDAPIVYPVSAGPYDEDISQTPDYINIRMIDPDGKGNSLTAKFENLALPSGWEGSFGGSSFGIHRTTSMSDDNSHVNLYFVDPYGNYNLVLGFTYDSNSWNHKALSTDSQWDQFDPYDSREGIIQNVKDYLNLYPWIDTYSEFITHFNADSGLFVNYFENGHVWLRYPENLNGVHAIGYFAREYQGYDSEVSTITLTITPINDAPTTNNVSAYTHEDTAKDITLSATDVDTGDTLTYSIVSNPSNGSLGSVSGTSVTYTPDANWNGTGPNADTFTYKANDGDEDSNTSTVRMDVGSVNDAPTLADTTYTVDEDSGWTTFILPDVSDIEDEQSTDKNVWTQIVSLPDAAAGTIYPYVGQVGSLNPFELNESVSNNGEDQETNNFQFKTEDNWNGTTSFTWKGTDSGGLTTGNATVTITVTEVNDGPDTEDDTASTNEDTAVDINIYESTSDVETPSLSGVEWIIVSQPSNGTLAWTNGGPSTTNPSNTFEGGGGVVTYTPDSNWNGTDTFTYKANDGTDDGNTSTITITLDTENSLSFNKPNNVSDGYLDLDFPTKVVSPAKDTPITYALWFKLDNTDEKQYIIGSQDSGDKFNLLFENGALTWHIKNIDDNVDYVMNGVATGRINANEWIFVAMVYHPNWDGSVANSDNLAELRFYVGDPSSFGPSTTSITDITGLDPTIRLGADENGENPLTGSIDNLMIWNSPLNTQDDNNTHLQITQIYQLHDPLNGYGNCSGCYKDSDAKDLEGYWNFNTGYGNTIDDQCCTEYNSTNDGTKSSEDVRWNIDSVIIP